MARAAAAAAVEKIVHKANEESRRLDETQVFVFKIQVDSVTFDGPQLAKTRGLRFALALQKDREKSPEDRLMLTPCVKPIVEELEGGEGRQQCLFNLRYELDVLWEGGETLVLSASQPGLFFSKVLASCDLPLALCYEQLVSAAKSCNPAEAEPLPIELELESQDGKAVGGRCRIFVHCWKESLKSLGGRRALRSTIPEALPEGKQIHSDAIKHKMKEIHECHSLNDQLEKAQANLWLQGVKRLTDEGALDSKTLRLAETCGLVSAERADILRQSKNTPPKLSSRSGSFTAVERAGGTTWLRFTTA
ncbi:unnamed protein product [Symbiodinium pilosum]|uniref:Uncharacterized protein n=1 Tax=Symbiodinium pilosum TaxID=2952 RepID=A0A812UHA0_SYMPI|nr:unnamed protein product [Symbiodinium pilosum]